LFLVLRPHRLVFIVQYFAQLVREPYYVYQMFFFSLNISFMLFSVVGVRGTQKKSDQLRSICAAVSEWKSQL